MKKEDLQHLTNEQLRNFYTVESWERLPSPIIEYVSEGKVIFELGKRLNEVEVLISRIVIERFAEGKL